jgi:hypothetical protein
MAWFQEAIRRIRDRLNIFYGLSLIEAFMFLLEKAYWQWNIIVEKLLAEHGAVAV